ncbi:hypothetical protein A9P82_02710 [Arachidicoccus ginsenosidimutans]|uniref:DoxX family protein n=1 Tax=Arachidicoccus sp. BS20 TaxID=1850526 RepID=UPI0007F08C5D|nr:hypothetical protein [Arachidicoccus sp. BS20]ANI88311.1 hypothetical protein A9P82_02710 [Arachidicoccus sp. BS20]
MSSTQLHQDNQLRKFFDLWVCIYVLVFILTAQFFPRQPFYEKFVSQIGRVFFHKENLQKVFNGSGDTTFDYVLVFTNLVVSYILSLIILCIDYKRKNYKQFHLFTIVIARYYVAYTLFVYGIMKLFFGQFSGYNPLALDEHFGNMSPMGVLWNFMGASPVYEFISGLLETIGGLLLLFRRTKTFGALFSMAVMLNVALLNYLYNVPVKILSTHIVLLCAFILTYEWRVLFAFFVKHKNEKLDYNKTLVKNKWLQIALRIAKILLIVYVLKGMVKSNYDWYLYESKRNEERSLYVCTQFVLNDKDTIPIDATKHDSIRWNKMVVWDSQTLYVVKNNDSLRKFSLKTDTINKALDIKNQDATQAAFFVYQNINDTLFLYGRINNVPAYLVLQKKNYRLPNAKFHWINEMPNNK